MKGVCAVDYNVADEGLGYFAVERVEGRLKSKVLAPEDEIDDMYRSTIDCTNVEHTALLVGSMTFAS